MALVLKAVDMDALPPAPPSDASTEELELRRREQEMADYVEEEEYVEPFPVGADGQIAIADGQVYPRGAFLSHGAVMTIEGISDRFFVYHDEHREGKRISPRDKANAGGSSDEEAEEKDDADAESPKTKDEVEAEKMLAVLSRSSSRARPEPEQIPHHLKPYWTRIVAKPKPVPYLYRSLIHSQQTAHGFECTFAKKQVMEAWDAKGDLSWCKKGVRRSTQAICRCL